MKILAIETSCDETCAAIVEGTKIWSNVVWSQIDLHKGFGGVVPSIAKRAHEEKIDWVVNKALVTDVDAVAVTVGPGLAIALEVGIRKAKELASKWNKPLVAVNHIEGHVLSGLTPEVKFPAMALVVSGGHTELIYTEKIGQYKIVARTMDDALGESLDKAARMLGLGYPGGAMLEKKAEGGNAKAYPLPLPMKGRETERAFSYSGLKTAMWRIVNQLINSSVNQLSEQQIKDLAAGYQDMAFKHVVRVSKKTLEDFPVKDLLVGGGVAANKELRKRLAEMAEELRFSVWFPAKGLYGDNAAMVGIAAGYKAEKGLYEANIDAVDREPRARIDEVFKWRE